MHSYFLCLSELLSRKELFNYFTKLQARMDATTIDAKDHEFVMSLSVFAAIFVFVHFVVNVLNH